MRERGTVGPLEWAMAMRPLPGQTASGDGCVVAETDEFALAAAIDGLGHGEAAAIATQRAMAVLRENPTEPLDALLRGCHESLKETRGAAITLVQVDWTVDELRWLGVGNVTASLIRAAPGGPSVQAGPMMRSGVVGQSLPQRLQHTATPLRLGDLILFGTDGLSAGFDQHVDLSGSADTLAQRILDSYAKPNDDALVLVIRYRGIWN